MIARGRVVAVDGRWSDDRRSIETIVTLAAEEYLKGQFGDVVQFIRYASAMRKDGATVCAVVHAELAALIEGSMPGVQCLTAQRHIEADHHVALMDLPMHYGTTLATIPAAVPYLKAPEEKVLQWRDRLKPWDGKFKIGLAWTGSPKQVNNVNRAVPLRELMAIAGLRPTGHHRQRPRAPRQGGFLLLQHQRRRAARPDKAVAPAIKRPYSVSLIIAPSAATSTG